MEFIAELKCSKCGNKEFKLSKKLKGNDKKTIIIQETLFHDGFGWELSTFDVECTKCKNIEDNTIEVTP